MYELKIFSKEQAEKMDRNKLLKEIYHHGVKVEEVGE